MFRPIALALFLLAPAPHDAHSAAMGSADVPHHMNYAEVYPGEGPQEGDVYWDSKKLCQKALKKYLATPNKRKIAWAKCIPIPIGMSTEDANDELEADMGSPDGYQ